MEDNVSRWKMRKVETVFMCYRYKGANTSHESE